MAHVTTHIREATLEGKEVESEMTVNTEVEVMSEDEEISGLEKSIELGDTLKTYEVIHTRAEKKNTPEKDFTLVDLSMEEDEVEEKERKNQQDTRQTR